MNARVRPLLSVVTPAFNEESNLRPFYERLQAALADAGVDWEWLIVDDHSTDGTFAAAAELAGRDPRVRCVRLARNCGSHVGLVCGLRHTAGDCGVVLAADLQDPPEMLPALLARWQQGAQVVWAVRAGRTDEPVSSVLTSRIYYWLMRRVIGFRELPEEGADFFLVDRAAIDAFNRFDERNVSTFMLLAWMGFRQDKVPYDKQARVRGASGWTLALKVKLVIDSVVSFSHLPIRLMSVTGMATALVGLVYAAWVIANALFAEPPSGWTSLMVVVLVMGGIQMMMLGVLGEYLWRGVDEARKRPLYTVEATAGTAPARRNPAEGPKIPPQEARLPAGSGGTGS